MWREVNRTGIWGKKDAGKWGRGQTATNKNGLKPMSSHHLQARPLHGERCKKPAEAPVSLVFSRAEQAAGPGPEEPQEGRRRNPRPAGVGLPHATHDSGDMG